MIYNAVPVSLLGFRDGKMIRRESDFCGALSGHIST
jgi:hypothetical protein